MSEPAAEPQPRRRVDVDALLVLAAWAAVLGLGAWSAWQRWQVLAASPYPIGVDGYYYPIQLRSLLERGHLAYPSSPLAFWLMLPLAALTDPITGAKLGAALGGAAIVVPAFLVGRRLGGLAGGLAAAVAAATTGGSFYLSFEFVKNGIGLTLALVAVWLALRALERPSRGRLLAVIAAVAATALTHKLATAMIAVLLAPALVVAVLRRAAARAARTPAPVDARAAVRRPWRWLVLGAVGLAGLAIALGVAMPGRFLGARELELAGQAVTGDPELSLPALVIEHGHDRPPTYLTLGDQAPIAAVTGLALVLASLAGRWPKNGDRARLRADALQGRRPVGWPRWRPTVALDPEAAAVVWAALGLIALTSVPWLAVHDPDGLGFRLRTSVFAPLAIVTAALVGRLIPPAASPRTALMLVAPALIAWLAVRPASSSEGLVRAHPAMVAAMRAARGSLPADAVVITAERDLGFQLMWYARIPVRMRPGPVAAARRWRMIPGNLVRFGSPLDRTLDLARASPGVAPPLGLHPRHPSGLVLVPEATWVWVLDRLPPKDAAWWRAWHTI